MKLVVFLGIWFFAAPLVAAAKVLPAVNQHARPAGTVYLRDWAERNGFQMSLDQKESTIELTNRWANIALASDSRHGTINGVSVWLSFPIRVHNGRIIIDQKDLTTLIEPVLFPKRMAKDRKVMVIALDAGHGGKDPGYQIGSKQEKIYTMMLAKEVKDQLEDAGLKTFMTRRSDTYVERSDRAELSQKARADLFVSLHYNTAPDPGAKGVETYCITPFGAEATNGSEQALRTFPGNRYDAQSVLLAYEVQRSITRSLDLADRGVRRAGFEVLRRAPMPSILIEGGFMSNPSDSKKVFDEDHRREMARAIVDGILAYKRTMERATVHN